MKEWAGAEGVRGIATRRIFQESFVQKTSLWGNIRLNPRAAISLDFADTKVSRTTEQFLKIVEKVKGEESKQSWKIRAIVGISLIGKRQK